MRGNGGSAGVMSAPTAKEIVLVTSQTEPVINQVWNEKNASTTFLSLLGEVLIFYGQIFVLELLNQASARVSLLNKTPRIHNSPLPPANDNIYDIRKWKSRGGRDEDAQECPGLGVRRFSSLLLSSFRILTGLRDQRAITTLNST